MTFHFSVRSSKEVHCADKHNLRMVSVNQDSSEDLLGDFYYCDPSTMRQDYAHNEHVLVDEASLSAFFTTAICAPASTSNTTSAAHNAIIDNMTGQQLDLACATGGRHIKLQDMWPTADRGSIRTMLDVADVLPMGVKDVETSDAMEDAITVGNRLYQQSVAARATLEQKSNGHSRFTVVKRSSQFKPTSTSADAIGESTDTDTKLDDVSPLLVVLAVLAVMLMVVKLCPLCCDCVNRVTNRHAYSVLPTTDDNNGNAHADDAGAGRPLVCRSQQAETQV